uniref:WD repeat-containing protein 70 n=1 Tax=Nothobranchius furzeri TaxID=105023 RepID=A0A8C6NRJ6_NOTFU
PTGCDAAAVPHADAAGKKARTFDLDAIFEQTRRTAIERSQRVLAKIFIFESLTLTNSAKLIISFLFFSSLSKEKNESSSDHSDSDSELIRPPKEEEEDDAVGPPLPPGYRGSTAESEDEDDEDEEETQDDDDNPVKKIPATHEITLEHGTKTVSALALDPSGARLVTGGYDYDVRFWDFAGMDQSLQAFRTLQPCECHQIKSLKYSITGDVILVVSGNAQAKVLDRDGFNIMECIKGDQYIVDMANTKGHTAMLNCGCWHPKIKEEFMTCSNDGYVFYVIHTL